MPLRLAFIGGSLTSAVGYTHFNASRLDGHFRLEAGCFSRHVDDNQNTAQTYGVATERCYADWRVLLDSERGRLDALVILTPTPSHAEIVIAALDAGYPVICEKALSTSSRECQDIQAAVDRNRGYLAVTFNYSGYPMVRELRRMIREGKLGKIQQIHVEMPQEGYLRKDANPQDWRRHDYAVPTVSLDLGVHVHHLVDFLTDGLRPLEVMGEQCSYGAFPELIDNVYCLARYQENLRVQAWWGKTALGYRNGLRVRVFGSKASAEWHQMRPETLELADNDGINFTIDRASNVAIVAREIRYNRFKAGHPSGFIEAFANLYEDLADDIWRYQRGDEDRNHFVYGTTHARDGLAWVEGITQAAKNRYWTRLP
ncbi:Gfo/Idh/MocA family protein [Acidithiobacillus thiooxidans]|nr:Gfo/Idh/MocA family oxidoreductase [Acidithiobacillus thiooxidans]